MTDQGRRVLSWVLTEREADERRQHAERLRGLRLEAVRYLDLDYNQLDRTSRPRGPRQIVDESEWTEPSWRYPACDSVDYGIELSTALGAFSP